ncbi:MAG: tetratricopeptide repeat protein [Lysobacteraceae bacterium]|nr:MAG: tetratricopeptide repeat protein [Xanthomonadaceae bacterium]
MEAGGGYAWRCRAALALAMLGMTGAVNAGSLPECARLPRQSPSETGACLRRWHPGDVSGRSVVEALLAVSDEYQKKEDFAAAEAVLSCAAAQVESEGDLRNRYEVIRRYGLLDYKREDIPKALDRFECALVLATHLGDRAAIAKQLKNAGSARRRLGDYVTAMEQLQRSLEMMRADHDPGIGQVLNNIADIHRDSNRPEQAEDYYQKALEAFRSTGDVVQSMHVYDSLADLEQNRGDPKASIRLLETALSELQGHGNRTYRLSVYAGLARAALMDGDVGRARRFCADGLALAEEGGLQIPWQLQLQTARADRLDGRLAAAITRLSATLDKIRDANQSRAELLEELGVAMKESGDMAKAFDIITEANAIRLRDLQKKNDQHLLWLSEQSMASERARENTLLRNENRQRTLQLWLILTSAIAVLSIVILIFLRRQQRERLQEATRKAHYDEMIARYRREADALTEGRDILQALLDSRDDALCLVDAEGQLLAVNRAAGRVLTINGASLIGRHLIDAFTDSDSAVLLTTLERMEDSAEQVLNLVTSRGVPLSAKMTQWGRGDGRVVIELRDSTMPVEGVSYASDEAVQPTSIGDAAATEAQVRERFRDELVDLMLALIETWERATGSSRIELAQKSRIWRVNIDDGRLRARAMERYLAVAKLPRNPRWRDVLRTAYFVLSQCAMEVEAREGLQRRVDTVLAYTRRNAPA